MGLIPGWGTKIPYAMWYGQKQGHMKTQRHTVGPRAESGMSVTRCKPRNLEDSHLQKRDGGMGASLRACGRNPPCLHLEFGHPAPGSPQSTPRPSVWGICLEAIKPPDPSSLLPQYPLSCLHILLFQADHVLTSQNLMLVFAAFSPCGFAVTPKGKRR